MMILINETTPTVNRPDDLVCYTDRFHYTAISQWGVPGGNGGKHQLNYLYTHVSTKHAPHSTQLKYSTLKIHHSTKCKMYYYHNTVQ